VQLIGGGAFEKPLVGASRRLDPDLIESSERNPLQASVRRVIPGHHCVSVPSLRGNVERFAPAVDGEEDAGKGPVSAHVDAHAVPDGLTDGGRRPGKADPDGF